MVNISEAFDANRGTVKDAFSKAHPESYEDIVREIVKAIFNGDECECPDPKRIHVINDGDYQGMLVFVVGAGDYQPSDYWYVRVYYGSCSGCDTLEAIRLYSDDLPTEEQVEHYMQLAESIAHAFTLMGGERV